MGRRKRVVEMRGVEIKTSGSGAKPVPTGDHGGVGKAGNQNMPQVEHVDLCPADANKFDQFGHKK